jgi:hypothetical protein
MLKPIPAKILKSTALVKVCTGVDRYQQQTYSEYTVRHVHVQPTNEIRKTPNNTDCTLRSILFADVRHSTVFDWWAQFNTAHENAGDVRVIVNGVEYTVESVDALKDDTDRLHHWEIGLV